MDYSKEQIMLNRDNNIINKCPIEFLSKYSNILGKPNEGMHKKRLGVFAFNDIVGTIIISLFISYIYKLNLIKVLLILFIVGELLHWLFCVETTVIKYLTHL